MNYRHIYHAGNFADVFRHLLQILLLQSLLKKDKPIFYLDTHAGIGQYDLQSVESQKSLEFVGGVETLIQYCQNHSNPAAIECYLKLVQQLNSGNALRFYPGSPWIAQALLRPSDRLVLTELHLEDVETLRRNFQSDRRILVRHTDGYQALKAFLPPKEKRGLVLIDPPFEQKNEFEEIIEGLAQALQRWATGIYAIWYPIKNLADIATFEQSLKFKFQSDILNISFQLVAPTTALRGCGMIIINPPWQFAEEAKTTLKVLNECYNHSQTGAAIKWLKM